MSTRPFSRLSVLLLLTAGAALAGDPPVDPGPVGGVPSDAIVLFDGKDLSQWRGENGGDAKWKVENGYAEVNGIGSIFTKQEFGDCQVHVEWASPAKVEGDGQGRGNSGVYLQGRYEIQVLDGYNNKTYADGQVGAFYGNFAPLVNAARKPGEWHTYEMVRFLHTCQPTSSKSMASITLPSFPHKPLPVAKGC